MDHPWKPDVQLLSEVCSQKGGHLTALFFTSYLLSPSYSLSFTSLDIF